MRSFYHLFIIVLLALSLTACMMGPNFHAPRSPDVHAYTATTLKEKTVLAPGARASGLKQEFIIGKEVRADWWKLFHSPELNQLITRGLIHSPNLAAAYAALEQAREAVNVQIGNSLFPAVDLGVSAQRERASSTSLGSANKNIFNLYNTSVNVSYTLDLFGGARRQIEVLKAQVDYQQFELIAAYLTLTSNITTTAINIAAIQAQIRAITEFIQAQETTLEIIKKQFALGAISREIVLSQEALVRQSRAKLPLLQNSLSQSQHTLSVLVGDFPQQRYPVMALDQLRLPTKIPVSLPSTLVQQRPDIRAAESLLHAASAQIGVATANLFPQFTLTANGGWLAGATSGLLNATNKVWNVGAALTQPLVHGGALFASRRQAIAAYKQAKANYEQTVLHAFKNVADALRALETDAQSLREHSYAQAAAEHAWHLAKKQYQLGAISYLTLLNIEQQYQQAKINRIIAEGTRYQDTAALFQALGGGWWQLTKK